MGKLIELVVQNQAAFTNSIKNITEQMAGNSMRSALKIALQPTVQAYTQNLQQHVGKQAPVIKRANGEYGPRQRLCEVAASKVWPFNDRTGYAGIVGPESNKAPHAHLVEDGTKFRMRKKIGGKYYKVELMIRAALGHGMGIAAIKRNTGIMPAFHLLERAGESTSNQCQEIYIQEYSTRVIAKGS